MIRFNIPYLTGKELEYIAEAFRKGHLAGDGEFSKLSKKFFSEKFGFTHNFLTTSGTDALEMAAILSGIKEEDEVIVPSYTFVSTANAFVLRGAKIVFCDSLPNHPNLDHTKIEELITPRTKVIVPVHYGGVACEMDAILAIAKKYELTVVEDAAQAMDSYYKGKPLGALADFGAFSFHETKNINCGEGGMLVVRDHEHALRAEIIREKGTNRTAFFRGEIDKYGWVDVGSSFLASEIVAAFLFAQLQHIGEIQQKRINIWNTYFSQLKEIEQYGYRLPEIPGYATNNGHLFYIVCPSLEERSALIAHLNQNGIKAVFHYQPLHNSTFYKTNYGGAVKELKNAEMYGDTLVRLPLFPTLTQEQLFYITEKTVSFIKSRATGNADGK
jgi:dTDP-4-amino-4,6-dideoxygalactose transaminase